MGTQRICRGSAGRFLTVAIAALIVTLAAGCSHSNPPADESAPPGGPPTAPAAKQGLSRGQKVAILVGAAAVYYLYTHHKSKSGEGKQGQYYLSKNGRVYYRDPNNPKIVHWVTPPPGGIQVPADEAQQYSGYQGYNNQQSGQTFGGYGASPQPLPGGPPGPQ